MKIFGLKVFGQRYGADGTMYVQLKHGNVFIHSCIRNISFDTQMYVYKTKRYSQNFHIQCIHTLENGKHFVVLFLLFACLYYVCRNIGSENQF